MQAIQALHTLSVVYHTQYWAIIIGWLLAVCFGWFKLGTMHLAVVAAPAPARPRFAVRWHPFLQMVLVQVGSLAVMGRLESGIDYVGASLAVRIQLQ